MPIYKVRAIVETVFYSKTEVTSEADVHAKMDWSSLLTNQDDEETFEVESFEEIVSVSELPEGWNASTCPFGHDVYYLEDCSGTFQDIILKEHPEQAKLNQIISLVAQLQELGCEVDISDVTAEVKRVTKKPKAKAKKPEAEGKPPSKKKPVRRERRC